jgi:hypothetical protein
MMIKKVGLLLSILMLNTIDAFGTSVIATVNGNPITDSDITARTELMARQGNTSATNRRDAFQNIVNDYVKINYANNFGVNPTDQDADKELKRMDLSDMNDTMTAMARLAIRADIAWGAVMSRTVVPTIKVSQSDIQSEKKDLIRERGLPIEMTIVRLVDVPEDISKKFVKPKNCDAAVKMAEDFGGVPQKFTALQYELSTDIRNRIADLPLLTWNRASDKTMLLVCSERKTDEYKNLDDIIKQNAIYRKASAVADQQLKQLRRKAVIIINDDRYKL